MTNYKKHVANHGLKQLGFAVSIGFLLSSASALADPAATALPTGGQIVSGSGAINTSGTTMTVQQNTDQMVANWNSFDIGSQSHVDFVQPGSSSIAINRIAGGASQIFGKLTSNGQVRLINPNGIIFGPNSQVDVGGLVASALDQTDMTHFSGTGTGAVINKGAINVPEGGSVALIASNVSNEGTINASGGSVSLAAGENVTLDFEGDGLITASVDRAALDAQVNNKGAIIADGGVVVMTAKSANALMGSVVNNEGIVQANTLSNKGGRLILDGGNTGIVNVAGTIKANGADAGETGGAITITGHQVDIASNANIHADGAAGGGKINIGGGWQGSDASIAHATNLTSNAGATITANATGNGNGGDVVLWSDGVTNVSGTIQAKGGAHGGNGGRIETSGHTLNIEDGLLISTAAPEGNGGLWLLDPTYSVIDGAEAGAIETALLSGDVVNSSTGSTAINAGITGTAGHNLSFWSVGQINVGNVTIETSGGHLYFGGSGGGNSYATGQASGQTGITFNGTTLDAGAGTITVNGMGYTPGNHSALAQLVGTTQNAGKGVVISGTTNFTGSTITINGEGGHGQNVENQTDVQSTVSSDEDFAGDTRPALNNTSVSAGSGAVGVEISGGANVTMTASNSVTINAEGGDGGNAGYLHTSSGGNGANSGSGATGYSQSGNLTLDTPTATINAEGGYGGSDYGEGYWAQYYDYEYGNVCVDDICNWEIVAQGNKLEFFSNNNWAGPATYGMNMPGNLTHTYSPGRVLNLISNYDAYLGGVLTASHVMMRGQSDSWFRFENAANTLDRIAGEDIDRLTLNHNYDTSGQSLHIGAVSGVNGIIDTDEIYIRVTSTGDTDAVPVLIQDSGASISFGRVAQLMANTMLFDGANNSVSSYSNGSVALRPYNTAQNIVIGNTDPDQGNDLYIPVADLPVFASSLNYLAIGGDEGTGSITFNAPASFNHSIALSNGDANITIPHAISVPTNDTVMLRTNGIASVTGAITATHLALHGNGGTFDLTNAANAVRRLSTSQNVNQSRVVLLNTGDLNIEDFDPIGLDSSDAWTEYALETLDGNGVRAGDRVYINTTGNMVLDWNTAVYGLGAYTGALNYVNPANLNDQQKAAVLLVAGGNFENRSNNANAITTNGANRFLVYSDTPNSWADQSTNFDFKMYAWDFYNGAQTANGRNGYDYDRGGFGRDLPASVTGDGFLYEHQPTLTINPTAQSGIYGETPSLSTAYGAGYTASGYIDGDDQNDNTGTGVFTTTATSASNVDAYDISYTQAAAGGLTGIVPKYNSLVLGYSVVNGAATNEYTVDQRPITIDADSGQSMIYGDTVPALTYTVTSGSLVNTGSTGALSGALSTNATSASNIGSGYTISQNTLNNNNYDITYNPASFTVNKRPITVTANAGQSKIIEQNDPVYQYTSAYTGNGSKPSLVNGNSFTGALDREDGEMVGTYGYLLGTLGMNDGNGGNNYTVTLANGTFRINPAIDLSNLTSPQTGITGTSQTVGASLVTSSVGPGMGSITILESANTQIVLDTSTNRTSFDNLNTNPIITPKLNTSKTVVTMRSGDAVTLYRITDTAWNNKDVPVPAGLPLVISGEPDARNYAIVTSGTALSSTFTGGTSLTPPTDLTFITPPATAPVVTTSGSEINMTIRISSTGVLVIEMPQGDLENVDPQTAMLVALAVARENFGASVTGIKSVYIKPYVNA